MTIKVHGGHLRDVVTVQQRTATANANGEPILAWTDLKTGLHANIVPTGGSELWRGMKIEAETTHVVTVRYWPAIDPSMRLLTAGKVLQIDSVRDVEGMRRWMVLQCREQRGT